MKNNYKFSELFNDHILPKDHPLNQRKGDMYDDKNLEDHYRNNQLPIKLMSTDIDKSMNNSYTLHYSIDGKTVTYRPMNMKNIINEFSGLFKMYFGNGNYDSNHYTNMRSFSNSGMYILSYFKLFGNTSKSKEFLLQNCPDKVMVEDVSKFLKKSKFGFKKGVEVINSIIGSFLYFKVHNETDPNKTNVHIVDNGNTISSELVGGQ